MFKSEAVECTTAACQDYEFYWDDGDPLLVDFDIFENVFFTLHDRCVVLDTFPPIHSLADYHDYKCEDLQHAMCAVPCHGGTMVITAVTLTIFGKVKPPFCGRDRTEFENFRKFQFFTGPMTGSSIC